MDIHEDFGNCGLKHIDGVTLYDDAKEAMYEFCKDHAHNYWGDESSAIGNFATFYTFSGAVGGYDGDHALDFANLIVSQKLGHLTASPPRANKCYDDGHKIQVWIWAPNETRMRAWWKAQRDAKVKQKAKKR